MPSTDSVEHPDLSETIIDLLLEARHLVSRERTTEDDNLLQIQRIIEAVQRELRRLSIHAEIDDIASRQLQERGETRNIGVESNSDGDNESRNSSSDGGQGMLDDGSGRLNSVMATTGQISIAHPTQTAESETRNETLQANGPPTELDLYLGHSAARALASLGDGFQELLRHAGRRADPASGDPLIQRGNNNVEGQAGAENGVDIFVSATNNGAVRSTAEQDVGMEGTEGEVSIAAANSPPTEGASVNLPGSSLIYTNLSHLRQELSFNFTDRRIRRATSSNTLTTGNTLGQIPRDTDGDSWATRLFITQAENSTTGNGESDAMSEEDLGDLVPLPSLPRTPLATVNRETASISSTGAFAGSELILDEVKAEQTKEEQPPLFTKDRRAQLMAAMNANIARQSQEREWAFYQEHGYCLLPKSHSPEPVQNKEATIVGRRSDRSPETDGEPEFQRIFSRLREVRRAREETNLRARSAGRAPGSLATTNHRARRPSNRVTLPIVPSQQRRFNRFTDQSERFLVFLLDIRSRRQVQELEPPQFEERHVRPDVGRFRYSLAQDSADVGAVRVNFKRLMAELTEESEGELISFGGGDADDAPIRGQPPIPRLILLAERDGLDVRESIEIVSRWNQFSVINRERNEAYGYGTDVEGFLPLSVIQFWIALRRGWGHWIPSRRMLNDVRLLLLRYTRYNFMGHTPWTQNSDQEVISLTQAQIEASIDSIEQQGRLLRALREEKMSGLRAYRLCRNWIRFLETTNLEGMRGPLLGDSLDQFLLLRLDTLILEERVINGRRGIRDPDGIWTWEQGYNTAEPDS
jgi:hypothetical protein